MNHRSMLAFATMALLAGTASIAGSPGFAADVTPDRLANADREPHNWLMNHRTYDAQRYSPLDKINTGNIKSTPTVCADSSSGRIAHRKTFGER